VYGDDDFGPAGEGQRFRSLSWSKERGLYVTTSADGVHWQDGPAVHIAGAGDTFIPLRAPRR